MCVLFSKLPYRLQSILRNFSSTSPSFSSLFRLLFLNVTTRNMSIGMIKILDERRCKFKTNFSFFSLAFFLSSISIQKKNQSNTSCCENCNKFHKICLRPMTSENCFVSNLEKSETRSHTHRIQ